MTAPEEEATLASTEVTPLEEQSTCTSSTGSKRRLFNVRRGSHRFANRVSQVKHKAGNMIGNVLHIFTHHHHHHGSHDHAHSDDHHEKTTSSSGAETVVPQPTKVRGGVRLRGCLTDDEHRNKARELVMLLRSKTGEEALLAAGFEYRTILPTETAKSNELEKEDEIEEEREPISAATEPEVSDNSYYSSENIDFNDGPERNLPSARLFHIESDTMITHQNRREFIADGDMYDAVAKVCQEYAQAVMMDVGELEWVDVCEAGNNVEPIRAIVSKAINKDEDALDKTPTLLIATGNGKVRAGIFSRQHLICNGMECSTALPIVREACRRKMNVIMLDPNVHGDRLGMVTFQKSMAKVFKSWEDESCPADRPPLGKRDLYILSHSQSGAQFAGYLLSKSKHYVPHIRAIAFTDSTHNIRWTREDNDLSQLLESEKSVYFKVSKEPSEGSLGPLNTLGSEIATDDQWKDRFGRIKTKCAGTTEHSLTNWFARNQIWEHFDTFMKNSFGDTPVDGEKEENVANTNDTRDDKA